MTFPHRLLQMTMSFLLLSYFDQLHYYHELDICHREKRFLALTTTNNRLGNQLYQLAAGYAIARKSRRKYYYPSRRLVIKYLKRIKETFPNTARMYEILQTDKIKQINVKFAAGKADFDDCCFYEDPARLIDQPAKYVRLSLRYAQNARYLEDYLVELKELFQFSDVAKQVGEADLRALQIDNLSDIMCVHIRRTDFVRYGIASDMNGTVAATEHVARAQNLRHFLFFGDDKNFMENLAKTVMMTDKRRTARLSIFSEMSEFYISSRLCKSFLLSAPTSTMGWWLAFFAKGQNAVYYYKDRRKVKDYKMWSDEFFLKSWHRLDG